MRKKIMVLVGSLCMIAMIAVLVKTYVLTDKSTDKPKEEFEGFIEASVHIMTFDELLEEKNTILAGVRINTELNREDAEKLIGYEESLGKSCTFYEAEILNNYSDKEIDKKIILYQFGTARWQLKGEPLYKTGDELLILLAKDRYNFDFYGSLGGANGIFYITEKDGEKYINKTLGAFYDTNLSAEYIDDYEKVNIEKSNINNPLEFTQRFKLEEFVETFNNKYKEMHHVEDLGGSS